MKTKFHSYNILDLIHFNMCTPNLLIRITSELCHMMAWKSLGVSVFFLPISHYVDLHWQKRNNSPLKCWHLMFLVTLFRKATFWGVKSKCICISWRTERKICGRNLAFHGSKYSASKRPCHHYLGNFKSTVVHTDGAWTIIFSPSWTPQVETPTGSWFCP